MSGETAGIGAGAMAALVDVYLNGLATGAASMAGILHTGASDEECEQYAQKMVALIRSDPAGMEAVRRQVIETLTGVDSGAFKVTVRRGGRT